MIALDTQGWDYLPIIENNYLMQGLAIQLSYTGTADIGNWIKLQPGTHTTVIMQIAETNFRLAAKSSAFNPLKYIDSMNLKVSK